MNFSVEDVLEELINKKVGKSFTGYFSTNGQYVVDITDPLDYPKVYSALDKNPDLEELSENNIINESLVSVNYLYPEMNAQITLNADLDNFEYSVIINMYEYGEN